MTLPDIDSGDTYDGFKENYGPVEDATTDREANGANRAYANVAMMTRTVPRAWAIFTTAATTGAMVLVDSNAVWGNDVSYLPTLSRNAQGIFDITWPTTVVDEIDTVDHGQADHTVNFKAVKPFVQGATPLPVQAEILSAHAVRVHLFTTGWSATDTPGTQIYVEVL